MYQTIDNSNLCENLCENLCIICYHGDISGNALIGLDEIEYASRHCQCNVKVHRKCIMRWYIKNKRCIMCNTSLTLLDYHERTETIVLNVRHNIPMDNCTRIWLSGFAVILITLMILYVCFANNTKGFVLLSDNNKTNDMDKYYTLTDFY